MNAQYSVGGGCVITPFPAAYVHISGQTSNGRDTAFPTRQSSLLVAVKCFNSFHSYHTFLYLNKCDMNHDLHPEVLRNIGCTSGA